MESNESSEFNEFSEFIHHHIYGEFATSMINKSGIYLTWNGKNDLVPVHKNNNVFFEGESLFSKNTELYEPSRKIIITIKKYYATL